MASKKAKIVASVAVVLVMIVAVLAITQPKEQKTIGNDKRLESIPTSRVKVTVAEDSNKPVVHSSLWKTPVPMPGPVNTAGAEDSPFMTPNGTWFFFFFTPDVTVPPEKQLIDGVTGIWWSQKVGDNWSDPEKVILSDDVSLDGAEFVLGTTMWFASVRQGNYGEIDVFTAEYEDGKWRDVKNAGEQLNVDYDIGEFHLTSDGQTMYFHTGNLSSGDDMDLWITHKSTSGWSAPEKVAGVDTDANEGYPYITPDGNELWFTGWSKLGYPGPAVFRSVKLSNGSWGPSEEIISNFAGESTMDDAGNIYFVHHFYTGGTMIEADIYVAYRQ